MCLFFFFSSAHPTDTSWLLSSIRIGCIARGATVSKDKSNHGGERETLRTQACLRLQFMMSPVEADKAGKEAVRDAP